MTSTLTRRSALLLLVVSALIMSTASTAAALVPPTISAATVGAVSLGGGGLLLFVAFARASVTVLLDRASRYWVIGGGVLVCCYALAFYTSIRYAGSATSTVVNLGSAPLFSALIERVTGARTLTRRWVIGTATSIVGLALLSFSVIPRAAITAGSATDHRILGIALAALAGLLYAGYTYTSKRALDHTTKAPGVIGATFGIGGALLLPLILVNLDALARSSVTVGLSLYLAAGPVFIGFWLFGLGLRHVAARTATTVTLLEPVLASILAVVVVQEVISPPGWAGVAAVVIGLYYATR